MTRIIHSAGRSSNKSELNRHINYSMSLRSKDDTAFARADHLRAEVFRPKLANGVTRIIRKYGAFVFIHKLIAALIDRCPCPGKDDTAFVRADHLRAEVFRPKLANGMTRIIQRAGRSEKASAFQLLESPILKN